MVDIRENNKSYLIEAELPGVKKEDINIQCVDDRTLVLQGKYAGSKEESSGALMEDESAATKTDLTTTKKQREGELMPSDKENTLWHGERWRGSFQRSFTFPTPVEASSIQANYKDGLLTVTVPKLTKKGVKVQVNAAEE